MVEKSLSADNIFIFVMVFTTSLSQRSTSGILGALVFGVLFVALGSGPIQYQWVVLLFGVFLILTAIKIFFTKKNVDQRNIC